MKRLKIMSHSPEETRRLGVRLGELAQAGDLFLLCGNLGAGKTCLTQGIIWGLGSQEYALSPTFVLMREMKGRLPLYHIDLYRLDRLEEVSDLGLEDYLYGQGVCVIEWADKALAVLPGEQLRIKIDYLSDNERKIEFIPVGKRYEQLVVRLKSLPVKS
jgi:tRNA threonylcarbamoyladenosine biosynthesis protein TsaE